MGEKAHVGRTIVYLPTSRWPVPDLFRRPTPLPRQNPALDDYTMQASKNRRGPAQRADCALGNIVDGWGIGDPVCLGDGAQHNARCPEARRLARRRERWTRVYQVTLVVWTVGLLGAMLIVFWVGR